MSEIHVLLVEDNLADVLLVREALDAHNVSYQLQVVSDGGDALAHILGLGSSGTERCPDILLLDLNLPRADGVEVLKEFRQHPGCEDTPVIVMSSSSSLRDMHKVEALGITNYFRKPSSFDAFLQLGALIKNSVRRANNPCA